MMQFSIQEQLLYRNVQRFRGGLVFKAHMILYYSRLESNSKEEDVMQLDLDPNGPSAVGKKVRVCEREREEYRERERE